MLKYCINKWDENRGELKKAIQELDGYISYTELMKLVVKHIFGGEWDEEEITVIDNGDYQGTIIFAFHKKTYQPFASQYLMTYISYGSCSLCDALQAAFFENESKEETVLDLMRICLHLIQNMCHPFKTDYFNDSSLDEEASDIEW